MKRSQKVKSRHTTRVKYLISQASHGVEMEIHSPERGVLAKPIARIAKKKVQGRRKVSGQRKDWKIANPSKLDPAALNPQRVH
jgi:hypothetical protein